MPKPNITMTPCDSSRIAAYGYCTETNTLALQFRGKDNPVYHYSGFEPEMFEELKRAKSIGQFFGSTVNAKNEDGELLYPFKRIQDE